MDSEQEAGRPPAAPQPPGGARRRPRRSRRDQRRRAHARMVETLLADFATLQHRGNQPTRLRAAFKAALRAADASQRLGDAPLKSKLRADAPEFVPGQVTLYHVHDWLVALELLIKAYLFGDATAPTAWSGPAPAATPARLGCASQTRSSSPLPPATVAASSRTLHEGRPGAVPVGSDTPSASCSSSGMAPTSCQGGKSTSSSTASPAYTQATSPGFAHAAGPGNAGNGRPTRSSSTTPVYTHAAGPGIVHAVGRGSAGEVPTVARGSSSLTSPSAPSTPPRALAPCASSRSSSCLPPWPTPASPSPSRAPIPAACPSTSSSRLWASIVNIDSYAAKGAAKGSQKSCCKRRSWEHVRECFASEFRRAQSA